MSSYDVRIAGGLVVNPTTWSLEELEAVVGGVADDAPAISPEEQRRLDVEAAFERGRQEGFAAGEAAGRQSVKTALQALQASTERLTSDAIAWREALERNLHALAVAVARHVLQRELRSDAETVEQIVRLALSEFPMEEVVTVRVNPQDLTLLSAHAVEEQAGAPLLVGGREIKWRADAGIEPGGCVVEGVERLVDGRVDTALLRIYQRLGDA